MARDRKHDDAAVRDRAHAIWEREGRPDGRHDEHWAAAVAELAAESADATAAEAKLKPKRGAAPAKGAEKAPAARAAKPAAATGKPKAATAKPKSDGKAKDGGKPATAKAATAKPAAARSKPSAAKPAAKGGTRKPKAGAAESPATT